MSWTAEKIETLKTMWADEAPIAEIASILSCTRNSVIGKAHRLKLSRRSKTSPQREPAKRGDCGGGTVLRIRNRLKHKPLPKPWLGDDADIPLEQRKTIFKLKNHHCRWPVGEPYTPGFFFCGHPSADLAGQAPYCTVHTKRALGK